MPYGASGGGRRVSYGYVRDAPKGFFVGGSSIQGMNSIYLRVGGLPADAGYTGIHYKDGSLTYYSETSGWWMAMVDASPVGESGGEAEPDHTGQRRKTASRTEWMIFDSQYKPRFKHEGDTILPGSGSKWEHVLKPADNTGGAEK